ncbi:MAG: hypothetical protein IKK79_03665 [Spirochaetaceae bacterium]|nr:hypothetical protein [Spirochaetaceae bacterium]
MRLDQPNQSQSIFKRLASLLLAAVCLSFAGCHLWYQDMKGYLEYWTGAVSIGNVSWSASPDSQKDSSGVDTVSANATVTASAGIINPSQYPLDGGIGSASVSRRSVRISGDAGSAALANASVTSSSFTSMAVEIQPLSQVPTPASLALEHKNFTMEFIPTRSDNALSSASTHSLTLRYNTPPRMPLEVMEYSGSLKFLDDTKPWEVVTGSSTTVLNDLIFWAWPSGITDPTHPDYVVKFEVYEDGVLFDEYTPQECLMSGQTNLQSFVPQDLKNAGYNIYYSLASTGTEITIYAVDSEGVRSLATTSGRAPHAITLDANGGSFAGSDSVTVYRTEGSTLNGGDLDIPTRSGFYLSGWTVSGTPVTFPHTVSAPVAFTAQWTANPSSGGGGGGGTPLVPSTPPVIDPYVMYVNPSAGADTSDGFSETTALATIQAAVDKIVAANDGSAYTILLMGDVLDSSSGAYDSGKNSSLVNIAPPANLNLTIKSNIDGTTRTIDAARSSASTGRVMYVGANASVTLQDVVVTGGNLGNENGGGVCVDSGGSFIMNDGIISGNYAGFDGGGVYVSQNATFIMKGGSIKANDVGAGAPNFSGGGGVYVNGGTFTMEDGEITQNNGLKYGGGVCVISGTLSMSGGEISSNTVTGEGGGVYVVAGATLEMTGGVISNNAATGNGGGVNLSGTLTMTGGSISGNTSTMSGKGVYANDAVAINLGDSAVIAADNDIHLGNGKTITITSSLTGSAPVATISLPSYSVGLQVLSAGYGVTLSHEVGKFDLSPGASGLIIDNTGKLGNPTPVSTTEVLTKLHDSGGSCSDTFLLAPDTTLSDLDSILTELYSTYNDSSLYQITLDLSKTTITEFIPAVTPPADSTGNGLLTSMGLSKIILPATIEKINSTEAKCSPFANVDSNAFTVECIDPNVSWRVTSYMMGHDSSGSPIYNMITETSTSTIESYYLTEDGTFRYVLEKI